MNSVCGIIGAGYSCAAGLPATADLFTTNVSVVSAGAAARFQAVWQDYAEWAARNPNRGPEEYLQDLYNNILQRPSPPFASAVELVAAVLSTPRGADRRPTNPRYGVRLIQPSRIPEHIQFWRILADRFATVSVVTTNYDLLIERALRHRPMKRGFGPGCYYGGLAQPQILKGMALPFSVQKPERFVELYGAVPVYKFHGSLNWSNKPGGLELFQDHRPAFRHGGDAAIVPPLPQKKTPAWLKSIWQEAERQLRSATYWVVCGYSLPAYDQAIADIIERAASGALEHIIILDPSSNALKQRYKVAAPSARIHCLPGLPGGLTQMNVLLDQLSSGQQAQSKKHAGPRDTSRGIPGTQPMIPQGAA